MLNKVAEIGTSERCKSGADVANPLLVSAAAITFTTSLTNRPDTTQQQARRICAISIDTVHSVARPARLLRGLPKNATPSAFTKVASPMAPTPESKQIAIKLAAFSTMDLFSVMYANSDWYKIHFPEKPFNGGMAQAAKLAMQMQIQVVGIR